MTIVVSVKVTDGIVLASDSATTFVDNSGTPVKVYNNANKIFNLVKGLPLGAMTYGAGSIGPASVATLSKDLRIQLSDDASPYYFDRQNYTVEDVAKKCQAFFRDRFVESYPQGLPNYMMGYRVCGYGSHDRLPQGWEIFVTNEPDIPPTRFYPGEDHFGPRWAGDGEALNRLVLGFSEQVIAAMVEGGLAAEFVGDVRQQFLDKAYRDMFLPAMPIQDAIELARFLAETAAKFQHFSLLAETIGGPIEIATITKHEGFKWVSRKHYFPLSLNAGVQHA